ncbi:MAG: hypothetical protein ACRDIY_22955 [Chloroflexota bacterium]
MIEENRRLIRARLRTELREIDTQVEQVRAEDRMFRRCGFGSDLHDIQLVALQARRQDLLDQLAKVGESGHAGRTGQRGAGAWLLLPTAVVAVVFRAAFPRRQESPRLA